MNQTRNRTIIKVAGESGQGVNSIGEMLAKTLKRAGFNVFGYREYPSLIRGGLAAYQLDVTANPINASYSGYDVGVALSRVGLHEMVHACHQDGILIHWLDKFTFTEEEQAIIDEKNIQVEFIPAKDIIKKLGGIPIMINTLLVGVIWDVLGLDLHLLEDGFKETFAHKPEVLEKNLEVVKHGYDLAKNERLQTFSLPFEPKEDRKDDYLMSGNQAIALGAMSAGVRAYYAYPMTPASSILTYMAKTYKDTGILVKQAEDEITAAQMTLGSMHMGTRALVGTSGGGFDLMTETVSLAMITEVPFVCVIAQRPGPATGVPTWTAAGDLNLAIYGGHGESARCVVAASDVTSAYDTIQHAFNIAEEYQIPVIVLTEKQIAESLFQVDALPEPIEIKRGLVNESELGELKAAERFEITESGISKRWLPGQSDQTYNANSDEHFEHGRLTEDGPEVKAMMEKRMRKQAELRDALPDPEVFGDQSGELLLVGWGSVKNTVHDAMDVGLNATYLHYEYVYPLKPEKLLELESNFERVVLIENNMKGQLGDLIKKETGFVFDDRILKYDGRPFFVDELLDLLSE